MDRITLYDFGKILVDGETHTFDVIIHPDRVAGGWWRKEGHCLAIDDLQDVWDAAPEVLVVGTGLYGNMVVPAATVAHARSLGIEIRAARTPQAVAAFNRLHADPNARVTAALHLTC